MSEEPRPRVLLVEDDPALRRLLVQALTRYEVVAAASLAEARAALDVLPDAVLTDVHLGEGDNGVDFARELRERFPRLPVVVMTAFGDLQIAIKALRAGAHDFLTKPVDLVLLDSALSRAVELHGLRREVRELRRRVRAGGAFDDLIGESAPMRELFALLERIAPVPSSVLIRGESGTGKELVARSIHRRSPRSRRPFVAINCAAVPESLLESELFGHARGAFTDAHTAREGLFIKAQGGTLFLDEIGDMPLQLQAKLLRVLQERTVRPVGSDREIPVDVRLVAATHQDIEQMAEDGRFRRDLLYRLDVIGLTLPPLRVRGRDVLLLAQRFVEHFSQSLGTAATSISTEVARLLLAYDWPGNVRELQNCIERAVVLCPHDELQVIDLPEKIRKKKQETSVLAALDDPAAMLPMHEVERRYILQVLRAVQGRKSEAARILEIDRKTLYRKLERWSEGEPETR